VDAAVAMLLCQGVSDPLRCGLGGGLFMVIYQRSSRTAVAVDAREAVPVKTSWNMFQDDNTRPDRGRPLIRTTTSGAEGL
jgi:gamma-glutamyltranspeptidase/glutathione hydrolase/leukotriene-C4 hydrolase